MNKLVVCAVAALASCGPNEANLLGELAIQPTALEFGVVGIGSASTLPLQLTNSGTGPVVVLSLTLTEGVPTEWDVDRNGVESVAPGTTAEILVTFTPDEQEPYAGELLVRSDAPTAESTLVALNGLGGPSDADNDYDGWSIADGDCNDGNPTINPGAPEVCNGLDDDCDGVLLPDELDADRDGWLVCEDDCDDLLATVHPEAEEICDQEDNDCDGFVPDNADDDSDGYSLCTGDCDDSEDRVSPIEPEVCDDLLDNDCDGSVDNIDWDLDGFSVCSAAGDCDDMNPNAHPVVVATNGRAAGEGTDDDPVNTIEAALAILDTVCRTVSVEPGTYNNVDEDWTVGTVYVAGRTGVASDVILDAANNSRHFTVTGAAMLSLSGLTLTGGHPIDEDGGAVLATNGTVELDGVVVSANTSDTDGGGVAVSSGVLTIRGGTRFDANVALDDGGAIALNGSVLDDAEGTVYLANAGSDGGAIYAVGGTFSLREARVEDNVAAGSGGGIALFSAGVYLLENNDIVLNTSVDDGGGLLASDVSDAGSMVRNNRFQDNTAGGGGGGIAALGATAAFLIANNTITGTDATLDEGSGILVGAVDASGLSVMANVLHSCDGDSALYAIPGSAAIAQYNTVWQTNSGIDFGGELGDAYGDPLDPTNTVRNPLLVAMTDDGDPANDNLTLQGGSPEIDSGPPQAAFDDPDGSVNDRGQTGGPAGVP